MIDRENDTQGYEIEISVENYISDHAVYNIDKEEGKAKINIGYDESDEIMEKFEIILTELFKEYQIKMWQCGNCNAVYETGVDEDSPNCKNCGHPLSRYGKS